MNRADMRRKAKAVAERIAAGYATKSDQLRASAIAHDAALQALGYNDESACERDDTAHDFITPYGDVDNVTVCRACHGVWKTAATAPAFTLTITLGNAAMQDGYDIAQALRETANRLAPDGYGSAPEPGESGVIRDENGNRVGEWSVTA